MGLLQLVPFLLDDRHYALHLEVVERVLPAIEITPLPKAPEIVLGLINLRGKIIPVLNIRRRFRLTNRETDLAAANEELIKEIGEHQMAEEALQHSKRQLRILASKILTAQEDERKRIALEVHDVPGSSLSAIKFKVEEVLTYTHKDETPGIFKPLEVIIPLVKETIEEARRIQADLRPPLLDDLGILATISWFCRRFETIYSGIRIEQTILIQEVEVPDHLKIVLYRIIQEAMNNIGKYARADCVQLGLRKVDGAIELTIRDNGEGFDLKALSQRESLKKGLGLSCMKERTEFLDGIFTVESVKGKGTAIKAVWPFCPRL